MANGIIANSIVNALAGLTLLVTGFASAIITARLLGPEANGIIAFSLWLVVSGASIAELGSSVMLLKMMPQLQADGYNEKRRRGFAAILITPTLFATMLLLALYAGAFLTSENLHWADTAPSVALVTGLLFVIQAIGSFSKFYLIGEKRLGAFFKLTMLVCLAQVVGVLFGAIHYGVEGALVGYALGQLILFIATLPIVFARRDWCDVPRKYITSSSIIISLEFIVEAVFLNRLELLFLQQFWSVKMVGFYAAGLSIANMALQVPIQLTGSLLPYYSERRHEAGGHGLSPDVIAGVVRSLSYITLPMSFGLAAISQELVVVVFGEAFREAGLMVALLALAAPGAALMQTLSLYMLSQDRARERLVISFVASGVLVAGCLALVPGLGGEGAAIARLLVFLVMCALMIKILGFGSAFNTLYASLAKVGLASVACGLAAAAVLSVQGGPVGLVLAIAVGAVVYVPALKLFRAVPPIDADLLRLGSGRLPGRLGVAGRRLVDWIAPLGEEPLSAAAAVAAAEHGPVDGEGREAALPVVFSGTVGRFTPEDEGAVRQDTAVLILSPWGYDEMCVRKSLRILSERLAAKGIPSLRYDYPGTGDALDGADLSGGLAVWENSVREAAAKLRELSGCRRLVLVGQGIGATLAHRIGGEIDGVAGIAMLAPVLSGRMYAREISLRAKLLDDDLGLPPSMRDTDGIAVAGLRMPAAIEAEVRKISMAEVRHIAAGRYLVIDPPVKMGDSTFIDGLAAAGADVTRKPFVGYEQMMTMPLTAREALQVIGEVADWVAAGTEADGSGARSPRVLPDQSLAGDGYVEHHIRFGAYGNLSGVVCMPADGANGGASVLLLTTALDRHAGWGETGVVFARDLARQGIASLRYDSAGAADSPPTPGAPEQILYSDNQEIDALTALDILERWRPGRMVLFGRCSGAYVAFRTGLRDRRHSAVLTVNPYTFFWDPETKLTDDITFIARSLDDYKSRLVQLGTFKRLLRGEVNVPAAFRNVLVAGFRRISAPLAPLLVYLPVRNVVGREVARSFSHIRKHQLPVTIMYSENDVGLDHFNFYFGVGGKKLERYGSTRLVMMPDTDHNFTPAPSRRRMFEELLRLARMKR
jgi:O-antigen/teichoic acid export membrane protein/alpha-beta hydrolase superfamily lysophospholipase